MSDNAELKLEAVRKHFERWKAGEYTDVDLRDLLTWTLDDGGIG